MGRIIEKSAARLQPGRVLINVDNIAFSSPERVLFRACSFNVRERESAALTGASGIGKSVLLRVILGELQAEAGVVDTAKNISVSYVPQQIKTLHVPEDVTVGALFMRARGLDDIERRKEGLERAMASGNPPGQDELLRQYMEVEEQFETRGGYTAESEAGEILEGLRFDARTGGHIDLRTRVNEVSSGQHTRLLIGQALFAQPDLLVLDDPSSHLDKESVRWFSNALRSPANSALVATTDHQFIDAFANKVVEIATGGRVFSFSGSYSDFATKRDETLAAEASLARSRQQDIDRLETSVQEFKAKGYVRRSGVVARRVGTIETRIEQARRELDLLPGADNSQRVARVTPQQFEVSKRSGDDVLTMDGLRKSYGGRVVIDLPRFRFDLRRGETALIAGENGSGKSTLMRMIASAAGFGSFLPDSGSIVLGQSLMPGYYAPDREDLDAADRVFENARVAMQSPNDGTLRSVLSFWGFGVGERQRKRIGDLSKGERTQLALAKLMLRRPNLILLDEPSNNLDSEMMKRFTDALKDYPGSLMLISHNPAFVEQLNISLVITMPDGRVTHK